MAGFERAWLVVSEPRNGEAVSSDLKPLLRQVYVDFQESPISLSPLKTDLVALLEYLNKEGRTNANCWAVDLFLLLHPRILGGRGTGPTRIYQMTSAMYLH